MFSIPELQGRQKNKVQLKIEAIEIDVFYFMNNVRKAA
jgi:hypothetical protein